MISDWTFYSSNFWMLSINLENFALIYSCLLLYCYQHPFSDYKIQYSVARTNEIFNPSLKVEHLFQVLMLFRNAGIDMIFNSIPFIQKNIHKFYPNSAFSKNVSTFSNNKFYFKTETKLAWLPICAIFHISLFKSTKFIFIYFEYI